MKKKQGRRRKATVGKVAETGSWKNAFLFDETAWSPRKMVIDIERRFASNSIILYTNGAMRNRIIINFIVLLFHLVWWQKVAGSLNPELTSAYYDASNGNLTLAFNSLVNAETFNVTGLAIQSISNSTSLPASLLTLRESYGNLKLQGNTTSLRIILRSVDYARLVNSKTIAKSGSSTYISLLAESVLSDVGFPNIAVPISNASQVVAYNPDKLPPFFSYYHISINSGIFNITFSEPIDMSSFSLVGLAFQGSPNMKIAPTNKRQYYALVDEGMTKMEISNYNRSLVVNIGVVNLNGIKRQLGMCITRESCFLSGYQPFVKDVSNNSLSLVAFDMLHGVLPKSYNPDLNDPYLLYWDFNLTTRIVTLTFSETVYMSFFNYSGITLTNKNGISFRVKDPLNTPTDPTHEVALTLSDEQYFLMQKYNSFFTAANNSYLALDQGIVVDTSADQNKYSSSTATLQNPMRVRVFYQDTIQPRLMAFELNIPNATLTFHFSETVLLSSMKIQYLTFQSSENQLPTGTELIFLYSSDIQLITEADAPIVRVQLLSSGLYKFYSALYLGRSIETTFLAVRRYFITDKANPANEIVQIHTSKALQAMKVVADRSRPRLVAWEMDMAENVLTLNFTRPILLGTVDPSSLILYSDGELLNSSKTVSISDSELMVEMGATTSARLVLSSSAQTYIKSYNDFCVSKETCYLSFGETFARSAEIYAQFSDYVDSTSLTQCSLFIADASSPTLAFFDLDMNTATLVLTFDKAIVAESADLTHFSFYAEEFFASTNVTLSEFSVLDQVVSRSVDVRLSHQDYIELQFAISVAADPSTTYAAISTGFVQDVYGIEAAGNILPIQVRQFTQDQTSPKLLAAYLDTTSAVNLTLYFSEAILASSLNTSCLAFAARTGRTVFMDNAVIYSSGSRVSELIVSLQPIKTRLSLLNVAKDQTSTYVFVATDRCLVDASLRQNPVQKMTFGAALRVGLKLLSFRLDIVKGHLDFEIAFPIGILKVEPTSITIVSTSNSNSYTLRGMTSFETLGQGSIIRLHLLENDIITIKRSFVLSSRSSILASSLASAVVDINNRELSTKQTLSCAELRVDYNYIQINSYDVDLAAGHLTLTFSNDITLTTYNKSNTLSLTSNAISSSDMIILKNATVIRISKSPYEYQLKLNLNNGYPLSDRENILFHYPLARDLNSFFLSATKGFIFGNTVPSQPSAKIVNLSPASIIKDTVKPRLVSFGFDLTLRTLTMNFSEAVNASSIILDRIRILNNPTDASSANIFLSSSSFPISYSPGPSIVISLSSYDVDSMMIVAPNLALFANITHMALLPGAFADLATPGNTNDVLYFRYGLLVSNYVPDRVPPILLTFNISIQEGTLDMIFNEIVSCASLDLTKIIFQARRFMGIYNADYVMLSQSSYCIGTNYQQRVNIVIGYDDLLAMKRNPFVLTSNETSFVRLLPGAIRDAAGNANEEVMDGFALPANILVPDTLPPRLLSFSVNNMRTLVLYFNEPVDVSTLRTTRINFQDDLAQPNKTYYLMEASFYRSDYNSMRIELNLLGDYYRITTDSQIFFHQDTTFMQIRTNMVHDTSGNVNVPTILSESIRVGPRLINWDLDMNDNIVRLDFSEPVSASFSLISFALQNTEDASLSTLSYNFTTSSSVMQVSDKLYQIELSSNDSYGLKLSGLIPQPSNLLPLYLQVVSDVTISTAPYDLLSPLYSNIVRSTEALQIRHFLPDITPPTCLDFDLDLNNGQLFLRFDEPVLALSLQIQGLTLFSQANGSFIRLSSAGYSATLVSEIYLQITLGRLDRNKFKKAFSQGGALDALVIDYGSIADINGNKILGNTADTPILISQYVPDTSPPVAETLTVDLSTYTLSITFDEVVDVRLFSSSGFTLLNNNSEAAATANLVLSNYTLLTQDSDETSILYLDLGFLRADQFRLEAISDLFNNLHDSYLGIEQGGDVFGNIITSTLIIQASSFADHTANVILESFDLISLSASTVQVNLYFSNVMDLNEFYCSDFIFLSTATTSADEAGLADSNCTLLSSSDSRVVEFTFATSLLDRIGTFSSESKASLRTLNTTQSKDVYGNELQSIHYAQALNLGPQLIRSSLDLNNGISLLVFSKDVQIENMTDISKIGYYSTNSNPSQTYYLSSDYTSIVSYGGSTAYTDTVAYITLDGRDLNHIKILDIKPYYAFQLISADSLQDDLNRFVVPNPVSKALEIVRIVADIRKPLILNSSLDMGLGRFKINFNEPIRQSSIDLSLISLQSMRNDSTTGAESYRLTAGDVSANLNLVTIGLSHTDASAIKLMPGLAKSLSTSFFSILFGSSTDYAGNYLNSILGAEGRAIDEYVPDTLSPILEHYTLDVSREPEVLTLYFSEPVRADILNISSIILQSRYSSREGTYYRLTGGQILSSNSDVIKIELLHSDIIIMKLTKGLIRRKISTYLVMGTDLTTDISNNSVISHPDSRAKPCTTYIPDLTSPVVQSVSIDMNLNRITLNFNEPVNLSSVDPSALTLHISRTNADLPLLSTQYTLSTSYVLGLEQILAMSVVLQLSTYDSDQIRYHSPLATSIDTSYLSLRSNFVVDFVGNFVESIEPIYALQPSEYSKDITMTQVEHYTLNMQSAFITLKLSETVDMNSLNLSEVKLQAVTNRRYGKHVNLRAARPELQVTVNGTFLNLYLTSTILREVKYKKIGQTSVNSYLSWTQHFVKDVAQNIMQPAYDGSIYGGAPMSPDLLIRDTSRPKLSRFVIDPASRSLFMYLDEPVIVLNITQFTLIASTSTGSEFLFPMPSSAAVQYFDEATRLAIQLVNYCHGNISFYSRTDMQCGISDPALFTLLNANSYTWSLRVGDEYISLEDYSTPANSLLAIYSLGEGSTDCSSCESTQYVSKNCTSSTDRSCSSCSTCPKHQFQMFPCNAYRDTVCAECSTCVYGYYIKEPCSTSRDTVCEACTSCGIMEYLSRPCALGVNAICESCMRCDFGLRSIGQRECELEPSYASWSAANCCKVKGKNVLCEDLLNYNNAGVITTVDSTGTVTPLQPQSIPL